MATFTFQDLDDISEKEYKTALGIVGVQRALNEGDFSGSKKNLRNYNGYSSIIGSQKYEDEHMLGDSFQSVELGERTIQSIVDLFRESIFRVSITNAISGIVNPLADRMELMHLEKMLQDGKNHHELVLYQTAITDAIGDLGKRVESSLVRTLILEYRRFTRHPVWTSFRLFTEKFALPLLRTSASILFGRKREKSDTDRIVDSIDKLREFVMTGQIIQEKTFFQRLVGEGILGMPLKSLGGQILSSTTGISRDAAQQRENRLAQGSTLKDEGLFRNFRGFVGNLLYGGSITRRGRQGGLLGQQKEIMETDLTDQTIIKLVAAFANMEMFTIMRMQEEKLVNGQMAIGDIMIRQLNTQERISNILFDSLLELRHLTGSGSLSDELFDLMQAVNNGNMEMVTTFSQSLSKQTLAINGIANSQLSFSNTIRNIAELGHESTEYLETLTSLNKKQLKVQQRTRASMVFGNALRSIGFSLMGIGNVLGGILGGLVSGKFFSKIWGFGKNAFGKFGGMAALKTLGKRALSLLGPIGMIAGGGFLAKDLYDFLVPEEMKENLKANIKEKFESISRMIWDVIDNGFEWVRQIPDRVRGIFRSINPFANDEKAKGNDASFVSRAGSFITNSYNDLFSAGSRSTFEDAKAINLSDPINSLNSELKGLKDNAKQISEQEIQLLQQMRDFLRDINKKQDNTQNETDRPDKFDLNPDSSVSVFGG